MKINMKLIYEKKGILITIALTLLALTFLSMVINYIALRERSDRYPAAFALERLDNLDLSLQKSTKDIFDAYSGLSVRIDTNATSWNVTFQEDFPNNISRFDETLRSFEEFVERNLSDTNLSVDEVINNLTLTILPHNINYTHERRYEVVRIKTPTMNYNSYYFHLKSTTANFSSIVWNDQDPGSFPVRIKAEGKDITLESNVNIKIEDESEVDINFPTGEKIKIKLDEDEVVIETLAPTGVSIQKVNLKTTLGLNVTEETISIKIPGNVINIISEPFRIEKRSSVLIANG